MREMKSARRGLNEDGMEERSEREREKENECRGRPQGLKADATRSVRQRRGVKSEKTEGWLTL